MNHPHSKRWCEAKWCRTEAIGDSNLCLKHSNAVGRGESVQIGGTVTKLRARIKELEEQIAQMKAGAP